MKSKRRQVESKDENFESMDSLTPLKKSCLTCTYKTSSSQYTSTPSSLKDRYSSRLLQNCGQLKLNVTVIGATISVSILQGRHLKSKWKQKCDSFVKISLVPDDTEKKKHKTDIVEQSNNPQYQDKCSFVLSEEDTNKRLLISVWHQDQASCLTEFLGCMSFGVKHLLNPRKETNGWYYLLTEDMGRKKHLQVATRVNPSGSDRDETPVLSVIQGDALPMESITIKIFRECDDFGFSVSGAAPIIVDRILQDSPAERSGLLVGDCILCVNGHNISRSSAATFNKLAKYSGDKLVLNINRNKRCFLSSQVSSPWRRSPRNCHTADSSGGEDSFETDKENQISVDEVIFRKECTDLPTSTPLPVKKDYQKQYFPHGSVKECIEHLVNTELDYIDLMHAGIERYSFPLRRCILSQKQHSVLFQNIEKLVRISEFLVKQIRDSSSPEVITSTYHSKMFVLSEAYQGYAEGLIEADQLLMELQQSSSFQRFLKHQSLQHDQLSISAFLYKPVKHLKELKSVLCDILHVIPSICEDSSKLKQITEVLGGCVKRMETFNSKRVPSAISLESTQSRDSGTGTMKTVSSSSYNRKSPRCRTSSRLPVAPYPSFNSLKSEDKFSIPANSHMCKLYLEDRQFI